MTYRDLDQVPDRDQLNCSGKPQSLISDVQLTGHLAHDPHVVSRSASISVSHGPIWEAQRSSSSSCEWHAGILPSSSTPATIPSPSLSLGPTSRPDTGARSRHPIVHLNDLSLAERRRFATKLRRYRREPN